MARELLDEYSSDSETGGASVDSTTFTINQSFAKRFEHNKKREELQKLEEKHGKSSRKRKRDDANSQASQSESESSDSEDEDDVGELATVALDSQIMATLNAIRSKDPRVYDGTSTFYVNEPSQPPEKEKQDKPVYLRDYHRENLLKGADLDVDQPIIYNQESRKVIDDFVAAADAALLSDEDDQGDDFLVTKRREKVKPQVELDVEGADKDPETFLSNFMAARAWVPTERSTFQPFESDDEEEDKRAEDYEEAYNFRFEDPAKSNERLRTHARDMAARYSVRREDNVRKQKREQEKAKKALEKQQRKEERSRLKKLRVEQIEEKVKKIKQAAGLKSTDLKPEDWSHFVDDDWNDTQWETEMQRRFGDAYYAEHETISDDEEQIKRKPTKPKFDDDIDIQDLVPDFKIDGDVDLDLSEVDDIQPKTQQNSKGARKRDSRIDRRIIEQLVDDQLRFELDSTQPGAPGVNGFRYRETSPQSFGLTARDILLADDSQLNQFAGLKKLATFRDDEKKRKDKKHLGKKARLRRWRQEIFGDEEGLQNKDLVPAVPEARAGPAEGAEIGGVDNRIAGKKKRRGKKRKTAPAI